EYVFIASYKAQKFDRENRPLTINDSIFIKDGEKYYYVSLADIRMFESDGNYVKVYFDKSRPLILRSLNSLEERLDPEFFFRANRKFILNLKWINKIENWFNGGLQAELKIPSIYTTEDKREPEKIEISRRQAIRFKEMMSI
ncbi:MAG: LytR/AlgR family response regulator transcription factor, partial [Fluviicola sp.]